MAVIGGDAGVLGRHDEAGCVATGHEAEADAIVRRVAAGDAGSDAGSGAVVDSNDDDDEQQPAAPGAAGEPLAIMVAPPPPLLTTAPLLEGEEVVDEGVGSMRGRSRAIEWMHEAVAGGRSALKTICDDAVPAGSEMMPRNDPRADGWMTGESMPSGDSGRVCRPSGRQPRWRLLPNGGVASGT